jgi:arginase
MNADKVELVAKALATRVHTALETNFAVLVLGGDCTVELGTVAGALTPGARLGLVYIDLDTDLNTPESTNDGALDWMGVAHLMGIEGTIPKLVALGPTAPMLGGNQILYFATDNYTPFERKIIEERKITEIRLAEVAADPASAARSVLTDWAKQFDQLLLHVDVDVLDYLDIPLAEERRRNRGLRFDQLIKALSILLEAPNWTALTIAELNPDHGEEDGSTLRSFNEKLTDALLSSPRFHNH